MYAAEFLTVALIHLLAVASPGPDFAVVVRESVTHGRRAGTWTALGVGTGIFVHVAYSLLGIGLIIAGVLVIQLFSGSSGAASLRPRLFVIGSTCISSMPSAKAGKEMPETATVMPRRSGHSLR